MIKRHSTYNTGYDKATCTPMFIEILFTVAKLWNDALQLKNGLRKCVYIYTKEFYSAIKKNRIMLFKGK
jgi:hypothetical protein